MKQQQIKMVFVGDGAVGKTCMIHTIQRGEFPEYYWGMGFDCPQTEVVVDEKNYNITLWDTAGQDDYDRLRPLCYPQTDIFLILFDVSNKDSFQNVKSKWFEEIKVHHEGAPYFLVGSKIDLRFSKEDCVTLEMGIKLANEIDAAHYFEVSSLNNLHLNESIREAIRIWKSWKFKTVKHKKECIVV
ncbi:Rho GTPase [Entamoeba marina]